MQHTFERPTTLTRPPIILVPGFWLGAWAWDQVEARLCADGHDVRGLTLPGLESPDADRSNITLSDHVDAICAAVAESKSPVTLVVHSGAAVPGYAASDRLPERIAAMVYVDTWPGIVAIDPDFTGTELPLPAWNEFDPEDVQGMTDADREMFWQRAIPQPGGAVREAPVLFNDRRLDIPSVVICTSRSSDEIKTAVRDYPSLGGLAELHHVTYVDLPTHHWPMWSRPAELAAIIGNIANLAQD